jgi:hypothetical protein
LLSIATAAVVATAVAVTAAAAAAMAAADRGRDPVNSSSSDFRAQLVESRCALFI